MDPTSGPLEPRPRLEAALSEALGGRLSLIVAAPGYGKSTALARMLHLDPRRASWCRCTPDDNAATVADTIANALAGPFTYSPSGADDWEARLHAALTSVAEPQLLLLDDVDRLPSPDLERLLQLVSDNLQPNWHVALTCSREIVVPGLPQFLRTRDFARLDEQDLALDDAEANAAIASWRLSPARSGRPVREALGWPRAMQLIVDQGKEALNDYILAVVDRQPPAVRRFLEVTAVLNVLTPPVCRAVTGLHNAGETLERVTNAHLFVLRGPDGLMYHPLFSAAVVCRMHQRRPRRLAAAFTAAADHYVALGDDRSAFQVVLSGGGADAAVDLLKRAAPRAIANGHGAELLHWIAAFPPASARNPWILHYRGVGMRLVGDDLPAAWRLQEQARESFAAVGDNRGRIYAVAELGTLACLLRRPVEAEPLLEAARAELSRADSYVHVSALCSLADAYVSLNRLQEAAEVGEEALARATVVATSSTTLAPSMQMQALYRLTMVHLREGRLATAVEIGQRAADLVRDHALDPEAEVLADCLIGLIRWVKGDLEGALDLLSRAATRANQHGLTRVAHGVQASMAEVLVSLDRLDEADALFEAIGNPTAFYGDVGMLRLVQGRLQEARSIFRQQLDTASRAGSSADVGRAKAALGVVALAMGQHAEAEQWLLDAARGFEQTGARFRLAGVQIHLAHLYLLQHDPVRCRRYLTQALDFAAEAECYMFFLWHPVTVATMAAQALSQGICLEFVEQLALRRLRAYRTPSFLPLLSSRDPAVREPATRIVSRLLEEGGEGLPLLELDECRDTAIRARLTSAVVEERLTSHGLLMLRHQHTLTWAELDVFVAYYLTEPQTLVAGLEPERRLLARRLHLSENTLMHHITRIRHKLQIGARRGSAAVFLWALLSHITRLPDVDSGLLARQPHAVGAAPAPGARRGAAR